MISFITTLTSQIDLTQNACSGEPWVINFGCHKIICLYIRPFMLADVKSDTH